MTSARLVDRAVIDVSGAEARAFLDRLVTCDLDALEPGGARFGALLTPQGKIISDFILFSPRAEAEPYLLDVPAAGAAELRMRLALYRLRAKLVIEDRSDRAVVIAGWDSAAMPAAAEAAAPDPRLPALGWRAIVASGDAPPDDDGLAAYHERRLRRGVPEAGRDYPLGDAFPHEAMMDQLGGVAFDKGCYVGQEVVSRMQHRGTARTRIVPVTFADGVAAPAGSAVSAGGRALGRTGEPSGARALASLRLDRAAEAIAAGEAILADGRPVRIELPDWVRFTTPPELARSAA